MNDPEPSREACFPATRWTLVMRLGNPDESIARPALAELCALYHFPLYCFIRRRGFSHHDAQDALHDFFAKGRLRSYLATSLHRFLINWNKAAGKKPAAPFQPPCTIPGEQMKLRYEREIGDDSQNPERLLDRCWAHELLNRVIQTLRERYASRDKTTLFNTLLPVLLTGGRLRHGQSSTLAHELGMTEAALRMALSRLLRDYRATLEAAVLETVPSRNDVPREIGYLLSLFSRS
jgi:RNA polymerase sigma-70 factor (ECF subfamily)